LKTSLRFVSLGKKQELLTHLFRACTLPDKTGKRRLALPQIKAKFPAE